MRPGRHRKMVSVIGGLVLCHVVGGGMTRIAKAAGGSAEYLAPSALAASRDGKTLYAACSNARQVAWVELPSGRVTRRVPVPAEPTGLVLTPDQSRLVVACAAAKSTVALLDAVSGELIAAIPAGHTAMSPAMSPDGDRVYVCNRMDNDVSVIDLAVCEEAARIPAVREPVAAAVTPDGQLLLVANHLPYTRTDATFKDDVAPIVTVIDTRTRETSAIPLRHGANGLRGLCVSPDGEHVLVTHLLSNFEMTPFRVDSGWINVNVVSVIDLRRRKVVSTIGLDEFDRGAGNPHDVIFSADGKSICVSAAGTHELCVIGSSDLLGEFARRTMQPMMGVWPIYLSLGSSLWRRVPLPGKGPRGLATAGSKVYVAEYFSDSAAVVDLPGVGDASVGSIPLGPPPTPTPERRGEMLFHDATICYEHWQSCASCHPDGRVDGLNWDLMNDGTGNPKNTKSMLYAHQTPPSMAASVRESAESAVRAGLTHILFANCSEEEAAAIDDYLKSLQPAPSPHLAGGGLSPSAERGRKLFESSRVACRRCHPTPLYTDLKAHDLGLPNPFGRSQRLDTPTLVEVWRTAPYLHDGRYTTIKDLLLKGRHGLRRTGGDLTEQEIDDLAEFVLSL